MQTDLFWQVQVQTSVKRLPFRKEGLRMESFMLIPIITPSCSVWVSEQKDTKVKHKSKTVNENGYQFIVLRGCHLWHVFSDIAAQLVGKSLVDMMFASKFCGHVRNFAMP